MRAVKAYEKAVDEGEHDVSAKIGRHVADANLAAGLQNTRGKRLNPFENPLIISMRSKKRLPPNRCIVQSEQMRAVGCRACAKILC